MKNVVKILLIIICCANCQTKEVRQDNICLSEIFYNNFRLEFLESDLKLYTYNPRLGFTKQIFDDDLFRVIIFKDSSIRVYGIPEFNNKFNLSIDTSIWNDLVISRQLNGDLVLSSPNENIKTKQTVKKNEFELNPVDYFLKLKRQVEKYRIIAIEKHPSVNIIELVFSDNDYLLYKPDTLKFKADSKEFMSYLFKDSKRLDTNWYQFHSPKNIDYN